MAIRILKNRPFARWAKGERLGDTALYAAAKEIEAGLVDARLGGFLIKKRVGKGSKGKRGGARVIMAHRQGDRLIFLFGFAKNDRENIEPNEKKALHMLGELYMSRTDDELESLIEKRVLLEVHGHD